jgi:hypothetical protein
LHQWLSRDTWDRIELIRLLRGDDVPASYATVEPYEWMLDALANEGERADFEQLLAERLAALIDQEPDINLYRPRPEQVLYNLLSVCAGVHRPLHLAGPLRRMFDRRKLAGEWDGIDLRGRLRAALASNQSNWDLADIWTDMAQGRTDFLPGNEFHGFDSILMMPLQDDELPLDAISAGLRGMVDVIVSEDDRREKLSGLVQRVLWTYQAGAEVGGYLLWRAFLGIWPAWSRHHLIAELSGDTLEGRAILGTSEQLEKRLLEGRNCCHDYVLAYAIDAATTFHHLLGRIDVEAFRRFAKIRRRQMADINVGVGDPVPV